MNQICHFEFIRRHAPILGMLVGIIATAFLGESCLAQNGEPQTYHSQWTTGNRSALPNPTIADWPTFGSSYIETSYSEQVTATQSPTVEQTEIPLTDPPASTLGKISNYLSSQTKKLLGSSAPGNGPDYKRVIGSLSLVVGCYFALVWILRMISPPSNQTLPTDVVEVLGKTPFGNRQHLQLVRIGSRLLLLLECNDTIQPIAEVSDPEEVHQLLSLCESRTRAHRRKQSKPSRTGSAEPQAHSQVHSFRIPAVNPASAERYPNDESDSATLANLIRVFENATGKNSSRYKNTYEA